MSDWLPSRSYQLHGLLPELRTVTCWDGPSGPLPRARCPSPRCPPKRVNSTHVAARAAVRSGVTCGASWLGTASTTPSTEQVGANRQSLARHAPRLSRRSRILNQLNLHKARCIAGCQAIRRGHLVPMPASGRPATRHHPLQARRAHKGVGRQWQPHRHGSSRTAPRRKSPSREGRRWLVTRLGQPSRTWSRSPALALALAPHPARVGHGHPQGRVLPLLLDGVRHLEQP